MLQTLGCLKIISCSPEWLRMQILNIECGSQPVVARAFILFIVETVVVILTMQLCLWFRMMSNTYPEWAIFIDFIDSWFLEACYNLLQLRK